VRLEVRGPAPAPENPDVHKAAPDPRFFLPNQAFGATARPEHAGMTCDVMAAGRPGLQNAAHSWQDVALNDAFLLALAAPPRATR